MRKRVNELAAQLSTSVVYGERGVKEEGDIKFISYRSMYMRLYLRAKRLKESSDDYGRITSGRYLNWIPPVAELRKNGETKALVYGLIGDLYVCKLSSDPLGGLVQISVDNDYDYHEYRYGNHGKIIEGR